MKNVIEKLRRPFYLYPVFAGILLRLRIAYRIFRLIKSSVVEMEGAAFAAEKSHLDTSLKAATNEDLRAEAIQWARAYCRDMDYEPHEWKLRFFVELAVGAMKGYF